ERLDRGLAADDEGPAGARVDAPQPLEEDLLLAPRLPGTFAGIDADAERAIIIAQSQARLAQRFDERVEDDAAEHRAPLVREDEDRRLSRGRDEIAQDHCVA